MLSNVRNFIECKVSEDKHISQDPVVLPCGYSACRKCYYEVKMCFECNEKHLIDIADLKTNIMVKNMIEKNIDHLLSEKEKELQLRIENSTKSFYAFYLTIFILFNARKVHCFCIALFQLQIESISQIKLLKQCQCTFPRITIRVTRVLEKCIEIAN